MRPRRPERLALSMDDRTLDTVQNLRPTPPAQQSALDGAHAEAGDAAGGLAACVAVVAAATVQAEGGHAHRTPAERLAERDAARGTDRVLGNAGLRSIHSALHRRNCMCQPT